MSFVRAQLEHVERFDRLSAGIEGVERRKMFGYPAAFVNGNMCFGLYAGRVLLRLPEDVRAELLAAGWEQFEVVPGRPMSEYVTLPADVADDTEQARAWLRSAVEHTRSLPPKAAKPRTKRKR